MSDLKSKITDLAEEVLNREGCELAEVVVSSYKSNVTLRVFVYCVDGMTLDRCAALSTMIGDMIEGTELLPNGYTLEVSSPGLTRPLTTERDFRFRAGEKVSVRFVDHGRKKLRAEVVSAVDAQVLFKTDDGEISIALEEIENAKIVF